jgi:hypothetical protein
MKIHTTRRRKEEGGTRLSLVKQFLMFMEAKLDDLGPGDQKIKQLPLTLTLKKL